MRHFIAFMLAITLPLCAKAQDLNGAADNILGDYYLVHNGTESKVQVTRSDDGTYMAKVFWVKETVGPDGKPLTDVKNPDKSLRTTPVDQVVLFQGMRYFPDKKQWSGTKVYDPTRGIRANATCEFIAPTRLRIKGSLLGISESIVWEKVK